MYQVTKTYGHERGLSCCFRQPKAQSHCHYLHGYSLAITLVVQSSHLNENNWVLDFGAFKHIEKFLHDTFDHKTVIAENDVAMQQFEKLNTLGVIDLVVLPAVGCEAFAKYIHDCASNLIYIVDASVKLLSVTVAEHGSNSATYIG